MSSPVNQSMKAFGVWLAEYDGDNGPVRDLAFDLSADLVICASVGLTEFDHESKFKTPDDLKRRLQMCSACPEAFDALAEAADLYFATNQ